MSTPKRFFAHTLPGRPPGEWEELHDHLEAVAERAAEFGGRFGAAAWAHRAGLWHDLGKYSQAFQDYLHHTTAADPHVADSATRTDHSTAGAQHAVDEQPGAGHLLAYVIAGHHSGLLNGSRSTGACLPKRLKKKIEPFGEAPESLVQLPPLEPPSALTAPRSTLADKAFTIAFFTRMLFSCLVDADFLETERFMNPDQAERRPAWGPDVLARMNVALDAYIASLPADPTPVNQRRAEVRQACLQAAEQAPGMFSLTVPTGGGKTLSSLAFALRHAQRHGLERVIYVVPFTTIIEQNADVLRKLMREFGGNQLEEAIVEHHSNLDVGKETKTSRLATENWDAPLIVTTSVQFYESLFANRTSRCRKLHRLAKSVIVLDEAQTLPVDYLAPCLRALRELAQEYGASPVLCTATQPAIEQRDDFAIGLEGVREIIPDPQSLYRSLRRVDVEYLGPLEDQSLAARLRGERQVLCVVNTRGHARQLYQALGEDEAHIHLSALMCPQHRSAKLAAIHLRLANGQPCRVISTQLIEAGVDIDFPVVYRSLAGLDSIAQAAGRCNRNGKLENKGKVYVFQSQHVRSEAYFRDTAGCAAQLLPDFEDPLALEAIERYFRLYYWEQSQRWDAKGILGEFVLDAEIALPYVFGFKDVAQRFRLIEDNGKPVIIPWGQKGAKLCEELRQTPLPSRRLLRKLQRYTVQVPERLWLAHSAAIDCVHDRYPLLISPEISYRDDIGLALDDDSTALLNA